MDRKSPYLGLASGVLFLLAVAAPFLFAVADPTPQPQPDQSSARQNAEGWHWLGVFFYAAFTTLALGVLAALFAVAALIRRERYYVIPLLVLLVAGGGSAYLIFVINR